MARVFIGMPAYNGERFIKEAIESLIAQTYTDWGLFISDDASTDSTRRICEEFSRADKRIIYRRQERNLGLFANFKFTLDQADGDYFMWAAQDDLWENEYLETCVGLLEKEASIGLATTCNETIDSFGRKVLDAPWMTALSGQPGWRRVAKYVLQPESLGKNNLMYGLFRTEAAKAVWQAYPQRGAWGQDYHVALALVSRFQVIIDPKALFKKRLGGYSSPQLSLTSADVRIEGKDLLDPKNPKNGMFPFGRFGSYLAGHREALRGTPYWPLAFLLFIRLPRALLIHIKERSVVNSLRRRVGNTPHVHHR